MGDSRKPLLFIAIAALTNLVLDLVAVAMLGMGVPGAALATVIGQGVSFVISLVYLYRRRVTFGFDFKPRSFYLDRRTLGILVRLGVPLALQTSAVTFSKLFVISYINTYGMAVSAVNGIGGKISQCAGVICMSIGTADTTMVGQNIGAGKHDRVRSVIYTSLGVCLCFVTILSALLLAFQEPIFRLFDSDPAVLGIMSDYVVIAVLNFYGSALRCPMGSFVNGIGHSSLSLTIGIVDGLIGRVLLAMLFGLGFGMGYVGFWLGDVCASYIPFLVGGIYFWSNRWTHRGIVAAKEA